MDVRLDKASHTLRNFLEDELSSNYLGISNGARVQLDRFRSFLHSYYVAKLGYYPPSSDIPGRDIFPKSNLLAMYQEFRNLYEFLADNNSAPTTATNTPVKGGLCVLQNITQFDRRHRYVPLPHPYPLLPDDTMPPRQ